MMCRWQFLSVMVMLLWTTPLWSKHDVTIDGWVVDDQARPLSDVEVLAIEGVWLHGDTQANVITPVMHTDADGRFSSTAQVQFERYVTIIAHKPGWSLAWRELTLGLNRMGRSHCRFVLSKPLPITGRLVDSQGRPAPNALVTASSLRVWLGGFYEQPDTQILKDWLTTQTDNQGRFRFELFNEDEYVEFSVHLPGDTFTYIFTPQGQRSILYPVDQRDFQLVLPQRIRINGRVLDPNDRPVEGIELVIRPNSRPTSQLSYPYRSLRTVADENGRFQFEVPLGDHKIEQLDTVSTTRLPEWVARSVPVTLTPNQSSQDVIVRVEKGGIIELDATASAPASAQTSLEVYTDTYTSLFRTYTDIQGWARLRVPTGRCKVYIAKLGFGSPLEKALTVLPGRTHRITAYIKPPESISGEILDSQGQPISDVLVTLHPFSDRAWTDKEGKFNICRAVPPPGLTIRSYLLIAQDNANHRARVLPIHNRASQVSETLAPCSTMTGLVQDLHGRPISAARVQLILHTRGYLSQIGPEVLTDMRGQFRLEAVPLLPEGYSYCFNVDARGYGRIQYRKLLLDNDTPENVKLGPFRLPPADQTSTGRVVDLHNKPVPGLFVHVGNWSGKRPSVFQPERSTITDANGFFTITRICKSPATFQAGYASDPRGSVSVNAQGGDKDLLIRLKPPSQTTNTGRMPAPPQTNQIQSSQRHATRRNK